MRCFGGEDEDSAGFIRAVDDLVPAGGPFGEHCDVAGLQLALSVGPSQRRPPGDGNEPLLAADLVVVGPRLLARRELVEAAAEQAGSEALTDYADSVAVAGAVVLAVPRLLPEEVEDVDSSIVRFGLAWKQEPALPAASRDRLVREGRDACTAGAAGT
jgi:hypothetical protein